MKLLILVFGVFTFANTYAVENQPSPYKGYRLVNKQVLERVLTPTDSVRELGALIGEEKFSPFNNTILKLMGYYNSGVSNGIINNGKSNAMSLLVYHLIFDQLSKKISESCENIEDVKIKSQYRKSFYLILQDVCNTPLNKLSVGDYTILWQQIHGFIAPYKEFSDWSEFHLSKNYSSKEEEVYSLLLSAFMNPYFIIQN